MNTKTATNTAPFLKDDDRLTLERAAYLAEHRDLDDLAAALRDGTSTPEADLVRTLIADEATLARLADMIDTLIDVGIQAREIMAEQNGDEPEPVRGWEDVACSASLDAVLREAGDVYEDALTPQAEYSPSHLTGARVVMEEHCDDLIRDRLKN